MPGPYAHLALVSQLEKANHFDDALRPLANAAEIGDDPLCCCILGTVSPDFPNLASPESGDAIWADAMHHTGTGEMIIHGIDLLRQMPEGAVKVRFYAWLLGYSAHVVADAVIHPVVQIKVGAYETNVLAHRRCELHQDFHIAPLLGLGEIGASPCLNRFVQGCAHHENRFMLIPDIACFWSGLLRHSHPDLFQRQPPNIQAWYRNAVCMIEAGETEDYHLFPLARNILAKTGLKYPDSGSGDVEYIDRLQVPGGDRLTYSSVFAKAVSLTADAWEIVSGGVHNNDRRYRTWFGEWNLDTGCNENDRLALW